MEIVLSERTDLTLDEIKFIESICRKQRKRLKSNNNKCNRTIDMFNDEDKEDE